MSVLITYQAHLENIVLDIVYTRLEILEDIERIQLEYIDLNTRDTKWIQELSVYLL